MKLWFTLILFGALLTPACQTTHPDLDISFWAGNSKMETITRTQDNTSISCGHPVFDSYVCLSYTDLNKIMDFASSCKK